MKKSNLMKLLFIALSLVLVISLVACVSETPTEEPDESDSSVEESIPNNESEPKDSEDNSEDTSEESSETPACEHVEEVVAGTAATCTTAGLTDGKKCSVCGETLVAQEEIPALGHTEEVVAGTAATCTTDGLTEGKKCSVCGETLVAQETIPAAHTEEVVTGTPATCETAGLTDGKKCSVCGETLVAQEEIPALGHTKVDKAFAAATTAEEGWLAHTICEVCGKVWDTEGNAIDAVPTLAKIVPTTNKYWGYEDMKGLTLNANVATIPSADRTYVRFQRTGECSDVNYPFMANNTDVTGQYIIIKYRTDHAGSGELWANTTENGHSSGRSNFNATYTTDGQWHIAIWDLSAKVSTYVKTNEDGTYTIQWARIDLLNSTASEGYFDIAYIAICDDLAKVTSIMQDGDNALCPHAVATNPTYTNNGDNHSTNCVICGVSITANHYAANGVAWNTESMLYTGTCVCGAEVSSDMIYKTEATIETPNCGSVTQMEGFVRYTWDKAGNGDPYVHIYRNGTQVTGNYMVIKYRLVNQGKNASPRSFFAGTVAGGLTGASGQKGDNQVYSNFSFIGDGEWHYMIIAVKDTNEAFVPNADGTYTWAYLRIGMNPAAFDGSCYFDVDEIAFCDNVSAAEYYAAKNDPTNVDFVVNFDNSRNFLNGANFLGSNVQKDKVAVIDMSQYAALETPTSLQLGGWFCVRGGVDSYKIRVTKVDGTVVETPVLVDWHDGTNRGDIYTAIGAGRGFGEDCSIGAGFAADQGSIVDLTAYAGQTVEFEIVAITNYGSEIAIAQFINVAVPAAE